MSQQQKKPFTKINFFTYNILAQSFCTKEAFRGYDEKTINFESRQDLLFTMFKERILSSNRTCIFALQEVDNLWKTPLADFFKEYNYAFYLKTYSGDKQGVAIAFPIVHFKHKQPEFIEAKSLINWKDAIKKMPPRDENSIRALQAASSRKNHAVLIQLKENSSDAIFFVASYHAPRPLVQDVENEYVNVAITFAVMEYMNRTVGKYPLIVGGDFNTEPLSQAYKMITGKDVRGSTTTFLRALLSCRTTLPSAPVAAPVQPSTKPKSGGKTYAQMALESKDKAVVPLASGPLSITSFEFRSAYYELFSEETKSEPEFTCAKHEKLICVDYIFYKLTDVQLVSVDSTRGGVTSQNIRKGFGLPSETQPSDHVSLEAKFRVKGT